MTTERMAELEDTAAEHSHMILDLIDAGRREELAGYVRGLTKSDLSWTVLALGSALLEQEAENGSLIVKHAILQRQNETFDNANARLFRERRELTERVTELRDIVYRRKAA